MLTLGIYWWDRWSMLPYIPYMDPMRKCPASDNCQSVVRRGEYWANRNPIPLLNISILASPNLWVISSPVQAQKRSRSGVSLLGGKGSIKHSTRKSEITHRNFPDFPMNNLHLLRGFSSHAMMTGAWPQSYRSPCSLSGWLSRRLRFHNIVGKLKEHFPHQK